MDYVQPISFKNCTYLQNKKGVKRLLDEMTHFLWGRRRCAGRSVPVVRNKQHQLTVRNIAYVVLLRR